MKINGITGTENQRITMSRAWSALFHHWNLCFQPSKLFLLILLAHVLCLFKWLASIWKAKDTQHMGFCSFHWKYALLGSLCGHDTMVLVEQQQFICGIPHIATYSIVLMIKYILSFGHSIVSVASKLFPNIN